MTLRARPTGGTTRSSMRRPVVWSALAVLACLHLLAARPDPHQPGYLELLLVLGGIGFAMAAVALGSSAGAAAWLLAGAVAGLGAVGYLLSRAVGLPGDGWDVGRWRSASGSAALALDLVIVLLTLSVLLEARAAAWREGHRAAPAARAAGSRGCR